jgi:hypothetical protein
MTSSGRQNVPAALHSELSEYASLLRAIRANSTLDLVPQLNSENVSWTAGRYNYDVATGEEDQQVDDLNSSEEPEEGSSGHGKEKEAESQKLKRTRKRKRDDDGQWTRWPLLLEHCPKPEWTFEEEISAISERCLRAQAQATTPSRPHSAPGSSTQSDHDDHSSSEHIGTEQNIQEFNLPPAFLKGLTVNMATKLSNLFSLLAQHRLDATWTKHSRAAPMGWRDIIDIAGANRIFDIS